MKAKKIISMALITVLTCFSIMGCSSGTTTSETETNKETSETAASGESDTASTLQANHDSTYTIDFYDVAANFQGIQPGWYGKILMDNFNIELNIISPQVSGDGSALYQTRCAAGELGDIVLLDNADMMDCVDAGLVKDLSGIIENYPNLMKYSEQIKTFNEMVGDGSGIYAIPLEMNNNGPTAYKQAHVYSYPRIGWDMYTEAGQPDLKDMEDLLDLLETIQTAHPTNENGDPAYAISLWPDWDSQYMECVAQIAKWYGQEVNGSVLIGSDNTITPITDKNGSYYKMLKFFYEANKRGLVDPDSATQDWNSVVSKMQDKRIYLFWYNWQYGFWNSPDRGAQGVNYVEIPVADTNLFQTSDTYYGDGRVIGVGSQVTDEELARILEFLDWYASPEGAQIEHAGTEGLIYTVGDDGKLTLTDDGLVRYSQEVTVPDDLGGGNWNDGNDQINQWIVASVDINPNTGDCYGSDLWTSTLEMNKTKTTEEWTEKFGAVDDVNYLLDNNMMTVSPSINIVLENDTTDISLIRKQCGDIIKETSWKMVYAADDAEFEQMWDDMTTQLEGFGFSDLTAFDTEKYQKVVDARIASK